MLRFPLWLLLLVAFETKFAIYTNNTNQASDLYMNRFTSQIAKNLHNSIGTIDNISNNNDRNNNGGSKSISNRSSSSSSSSSSSISSQEEFQATFEEDQSSTNQNQKNKIKNNIVLNEFNDKTYNVTNVDINRIFFSSNRLNSALNSIKESPVDLSQSITAESFEIDSETPSSLLLKQNLFNLNNNVASKQRLKKKLKNQLASLDYHVKQINNLLSDYIVADLPNYQSSLSNQANNLGELYDNDLAKASNSPETSSSIQNKYDSNNEITLSQNEPLDTGRTAWTPLKTPQTQYWSPVPNQNNYSNVSNNLKDENSSLDDYVKEKTIGVCKDGLIIPAWQPLYNLSRLERFLRGLVYFLSLCYLFVGVSIIADRFMAAIEVITSQERDVIIRQVNGETHIISVRIWNETVSNLTLMALGSSAPEILLSIIEVYAQDFNPGDLGPGTIVGSAAFNMFVIISICVWTVPSNEVKKIKHLRVYCLTMVWSVFAYLWLVIILSYISKGVVEIWEGLLTFAFFPATVITAYVADRRLLFYKYIGKKYRMNRHGIIVESEGLTADEQHPPKNPTYDLELAPVPKDKRKSSNFLNFRNASLIGSLTGSTTLEGGLKVFECENDSEEIREFQQHRREYISILKELRKKHPDAAMETLEMLAREEIVNRGPKSRAFYRLQATKKLTGGTVFRRRIYEQERKDSSSTAAALAKPVREDNVILLYFDPAHYTVFENVGQFAVNIVRDGPTNCELLVNVKSEDGTANSGSDYIEINEDVHFEVGEEFKKVFIQVIDDDIFEEDEHFYVHLSNPRLISPNTQITNRLNKQSSLEQTLQDKPLEVRLGTASNATVMILDDDHSGVFSFPTAEVEINESIGLYLLKVVRNSGARGRVIIPYKILEAGAKKNVDFKLEDGELVFENNETWQEIPVQIIDNETYEKSTVFFVELGEPKRDDENVASQGKPRIGDFRKCQIRIKESQEFKNTVDKLFHNKSSSLVFGVSSWREQFINAITLHTDSDDEDDNEEELKTQKKRSKSPTLVDYLIHLITLFWKVLFAFVPPTDYCNGWLCFWTSICVIGILTAIIGDLSSQLGCSVGLKDTVTAIAFVALGTSVPDTFASKVAAKNDKFADSSIGNVTGSNAVNVFLGIGIAWTLAAVIKMKRGEQFKVEPGSLAFSVTLFCICAAICCTVLIIRRYTIGGELGGPMKWKFLTSFTFVCLWLFYVFMSTLETYHLLPF